EATDIDAVVFPNLFRKAKKLLDEETIVEVQGKIEKRNDRIQYVLNHIVPFDPGLYQKDMKRLFIKVTKQNNENTLEVIQDISSKHKGNTPIIVYYEEQKKTYQLTKDYYVHPSNRCMQELITHFGEQNVVLQK